MNNLAMLRNIDASEQKLRSDLAAVFRMVARLDWHEGVANHFSVALPGPGRRFLMNRKWRHFSLMTASDLLLLDADDPSVMEGPEAPDPTAWAIHGTMHRVLPNASCILHVHSPYATALSGLKDPCILPIDQTTARFFNRMSIDTGYTGMADDTDEGTRLAHMLGNNEVMMMGNHGVLVTGKSIAEAYDTLYHLERACRTLMLAYASGQELSILSDAVAEQTARDWESFTDSSFTHLAEVRRILDRHEPDYVN
ncbi:class II aldolase/adducin family protein [Ancylobacter sp. 6x-1]|uniref:Class II aldolase/adducin family protein n=1 Tax=Ancylobacter crimeensis TaxID=2579147 RepID=A0ABT0D6Z4_9HYPH|nr:class II aldolase/adducin family protein [Ancylobacter crimeensis]MCK0195721.1 class II aldolase/adducin family protein [Ancylobacter crimeensis]